VLAQHPNADLRVYAIWFSMFGSEQREHWPSDALTDPRVVHFWDEEKVVGRWYMQRLAGIQEQRAPKTSGATGPVLWDAYLLYGAESVWEETPTGLRSWGRTILRTQDTLRTSVSAALERAGRQ